MKQVIFSSFIIGILFISAVVIILYARGYRINPKEKSLEPTGTLVAKSEPDGAQVYIDDVFYGATNSTINLPPKWYDVRIKKQGYHEWKRKIKIDAEVVSRTDAVLFLKNPSLSAMISTGVVDPLLSPDGTKIAYIATPSSQKRTNNLNENQGASIFESTLQRPTLFIYDLTGRNLPFSKNPQPYNGPLESLLAEWKLERQTSNAVTLRAFPKEFQHIATDSIRIVSFAPDKSKVLYEATNSAVLKRAIVPPLIGGLSTKEERKLTTGNLYVYDKKDDRNYKLNYKVDIPELDTKPLPIQWLSTSRHFIVVENDKISVMEYDGANKITVYSGLFVNGYVFPHPVGHQIIIMTSLNPKLGELPSLYTLTIR